jgi:hypothetical protein
MCRAIDLQVFLRDDENNTSATGQLCAHCGKLFHYVCMYSSFDNLFCYRCFKKEVVLEALNSRSLEGLFGHVNTYIKDGFTMTTCHDLESFVFRYLKEVECFGTKQQQYLSPHEWDEEYEKFLSKIKLDIDKAKSGKRQKIYEQRMKKAIDKRQFQRRKYYKAVESLVRFWLRNTDAVVTGIRYNKWTITKFFSVRGRFCVNGEADNDGVKVDSFKVKEDWVIDTFGTDLAKELKDLADQGDKRFHQNPVSLEGSLATFMVDHKKILKVKQDSESNWHGVDEDGNVVELTRDAVKEQFGECFVREVEGYQLKQFHHTPVGSVRRSVLQVMPHLRQHDAPVVRFMQGDSDTCVFSSFASALYSSGDQDLVFVANQIQVLAKQYEGSVATLPSLQCIVQERLAWLQPKCMKAHFDWQKDLGEYDFFVGVMRDSTGSTQHAVSIHHGWIFDSNEPYALPLSQESLNCCTWEIKNGIVEPSSFVKFEKGIIFQSQKRKVGRHSACRKRIRYKKKPSLHEL